MVVIKRGQINVAVKLKLVNDWNLNSFGAQISSRDNEVVVRREGGGGGGSTLKGSTLLQIDDLSCMRMYASYNIQHNVMAQRFDRFTACSGPAL